jgi:AraC family transcriptional regulator
MPNVEIVNFPDTKVALLEHHGDPKSIGKSIQRFIAYRKQYHLHPSTNAIFNIVYNSPTEVPVQDFRIDLCVATDQTVGDNQYGIVSKTIPGGRCGVVPAKRNLIAVQESMGF